MHHMQCLQQMLIILNSWTAGPNEVNNNLHSRQYVEGEERCPLLELTMRQLGVKDYFRVLRRAPRDRGGVRSTGRSRQERTKQRDNKVDYNVGQWEQ